jgi:hypothetical protein
VTYLLDTAPWINGVTLPEVLPPRIRRLLAFFAVGLASDLEVIELTPAVAVRTNELPAHFQGDPFDRAIVATAAVLNLTLVTADPAIRDAGACAVEYYPFKPSHPKRLKRQE